LPLQQSNRRAAISIPIDTTPKLKQTYTNQNEILGWSIHIICRWS
jgi:hypothetical protein